MPLDFVPSVCPHDCPSTCALEVERLSPTRIGKVRGAAGNSYTAGVVCAKVARYAERQHHPDRLAFPLRRVGPKGEGIGAFQQISWEAALDEVAEAFERAAARHGREAVWPYFYAGTMGLVQRDGIERLRHAMGYSRMLSTICVALSDSGWLAGVGVKYGVDSREIADSDLIVVWGGNPVATQVNVMTHISQARKQRAAPLVVVDPYRTGTADVADLHLMPRPGTDGALACAVMHVLFREGFADREYLARYTDVPAELEAHLQSRTPEWAEAISGVPAASIVDFARLYGRCKKSFIRIGYGFSRSRNGAAQLHAVSCLPAVTGAWRERGGGALYSNGGLYRLDKTLIEGLDLLDPKTRLLDQSRIGPILTGDRRDQGEGPPVTAMLIQNTNPAVVCPDSNKVRQGFAREDLFTCVHEQFMTDTAKMADIVRPGTTFLEHDDIYTAGGHTYFQLARPVVEPYAEARPNHYVICELARRLGAQHRGFEMSEREIIEETLRLSGKPSTAAFDSMRRAGIDCAPPLRGPGISSNGFGHADGKFRFKPDWKRHGYRSRRRSPVLPDFMPSSSITADAASIPSAWWRHPARQFRNSTFTETRAPRAARENRPTVMIHPVDSARLAISEGDRLRLGNRRGSIVLHARIFDGLQPGVVVVESIWPNGAFEEGIGVNALTSADAGPPKGGAVFHDTAIWMGRPLEA